MSKELEALEKFLNDYLTLCEKLHTNRQEKMLLDKNSSYNVLKTYLQFIDNAESSKALEALERLKTAPTFMGGTPEYQACTKSETLLLQDYEIIKQALLNAEKEHKALEIIKEKNVWIARLKSLFKRYNNDLDVLRIYNANAYKIDYQLTQEQFNLLKEVL